MKKLIIALFTVLFLIPASVFAKEPVKVYIFEAGGCPACEAQINYLEGLDSYNDKFVIVHKEAYVDHVDWAQGADYDLTVSVANAFKNKGYEDATYQATPFVVVGNVYGAAGYNASLESIINQVYDEGETDVVACFEEGRSDCEGLIEANATTSYNKTSTSKDISNNNDVIWTIIVCTLLLVGIYWYKSTADTNKILSNISK